MIPGTLTRNILRFYRQADLEQVEAGLAWYDGAQIVCERIGERTGHTPTQAVVALAHLSPRAPWARNVVALEALLAGEPRPTGVLGRSWEAAGRSLTAEDPLATFSQQARKTAAFARAILGDGNSVCVDVWAARVAGAEARLLDSQWGYVAIAEAYRRAGAIEKVRPRDLQAITWCAIRGRAD